MMEQIEKEGKIPYLKGDALIGLKIGTAFVQQLSSMIEYLTTGHETDLKSLADKKGDYKDITPWENAMITITMLLREVYKVAEENNLLEYKTAEEVVKGLTPNNQDQD
jgi:hypothetical protein